MTASEFDPCRWMSPALEVAKRAGCRIMEVYDAGFNVEQKKDETPLTEADMAAHHAIEEGLRALTPEVPVLSEEAAQIPFAERQQWRRYWLVDPLDGTREFIRRNGEFSVNIALIDDHLPVLGIVYAPVLGLCYFACRGGGAFKQEALERPVRIRARPYERGCVVVAGSRSHRGKAMERFLSHLSAYQCIPLGSALKSCLVAEGKADVYPRLGPTSEWDTAAAQCVLEEAGGHLTDTHMRALRYNTKDSLLNPHFFAYGASTVDWSRYL